MMKQYTHIAAGLLIVFTMLLMSGCKSKKAITTDNRFVEKTHAEVISDVLRSEIDYRTITTKGSVEFNSGNSSKKAPAVFKIVKDSILQVSVRIPLLGGEIMRMDITPESIVLIDRWKKQYFSQRFEESGFLRQLDFNFYNLQALFTDKIFIPGQQAVSTGDFDKYTVYMADSLYMLQTKGKGELLYNFAADAADHIISTLIYNEKQQVSLQWSYMDFIKDNALIYPTNMEAKIEVGKMRAGINISYNKLDVDKDFNVDTSIPAKYTKVEFKDLLGSYMKLK